MSVRRSLAWTYSAQALSFLITFGSTIIVARIVSPRDFGIFAMATAATAIINVIMNLGLAKYVMREEEIDRDSLRTIFTVNCVMTVLYVGAIVLSGIAAAYLFDSPELGRFLLVFSLFPFFALFEFIPAALCAREMRFRTIAIMSLVRAAVFAASTILLALQGLSYMSFAWAQILSWLATSVAFNIIEWRPECWKPRFAGMKSVLHFGSQMVGITGLNQLSSRGSEMILGSMLGLANLGLYTRASSLPAQVHTNVFGTGSNVFFSRLSQDLRNTGNLRETYLQFMRLILGAVWPMMFGLAVLAQPVIYTLYGEQWQAAATPLALLSVAAAITVATGMTSEVFILRRETSRQIRIEGVRAVLGLLLFVGGAAFSLTLAATAKIIEALIAFILYKRPMTRLTGCRYADLGKVYGEAFVLSVAAILPALTLMVWTGWSPATPILPAVSAVALGVSLWFILLVVTGHPIAQEVGRVARLLLPKRART